MKRWIGRGWSLLGKHRTAIYYVCYAFLMLGLVGQFLALSSIAARNTEPRSVMRAYDNDGMEAISVAERTRLWNDNMWRPYGPVYYRMVHLFARSVDWPGFSDLTEEESQQKGISFYLLIVNLMCLFLTTYLIAWCITRHLLLQVVFSQTLNMILLQDNLWSHMSLRPHPDYALVLTVAIMMVLTGRFFFNQKADRFWTYSAWAWGVAASTKLVLILFLPALIFPLMAYDSKHRFKKMIHFCKHSLLAYFIVGFPQNFAFWETIGFLLRQSKNSVAPDWNSFFSWLELYQSQLLPALLVIGLFCLMTPYRNTRIGPQKISKRYFLAVGFFILPTLILFSRKILPPFEWYPMPFVIALLVGSVFFIPSLTRIKQARRLHKYVHHGAVSIAIFLVWPILSPAIPARLLHEADNSKACRQEYHGIKKIVHDVIKSGGHVLGDPYVPFLESLGRRNDERIVNLPWEIHPEMIKRETELIVLKYQYYRRYLPVEEGGNGIISHYIKDWPKTRAFYRLFNGKSETVGPHGMKWVKSKTVCDFELWEKVPRKVPG